LDIIKNVDLREALMDIAKQNTLYNLENDLQVSLELMERALKIDNALEKDFIWVSYPSGIDCYVEHEAFLFDTRGYNGILYHCEGAEREPKLAYTVEVTAKKDGSIFGNIFEMDIKKYTEHLKSHVLRPNTVRLYTQDVRDTSKQIVMPLDEFNKRYPFDLPKAVFWRYKTADQTSLHHAINKSWDMRWDSPKSCRIWEHTNKLGDRRLEFHANKMVKEINRLKEPNTHDKQNFAVSLDACIANNFMPEQLSRLLDKIPYKNAAFAVQKGQSSMKLVVPKNEVLQLRQQRDDKSKKSEKPSVLATLDANEKKSNSQFSTGKDSPNKDVLTKNKKGMEL